MDDSKLFESIELLISDFSILWVKKLNSIEINYNQIINDSTIIYSRNSLPQNSFFSSETDSDKVLIDDRGIKTHNGLSPLLIAIFNKSERINERQQQCFSNLNEDFTKIAKFIFINHSENVKTSQNFNTLRLFNIDETIHSRLLEKLLNPKSNHGQGKLFLLEFLKLLKIYQPEIGEWCITEGKGKIDVLLKRYFPESIVIIENKAKWAVDQPNQLYRYWHQEIYNRTHEKSISYYLANDNRFKILYLSPNENKQPEIQSLTRPNFKNWKNTNLPEVIPLKVDVKAYNDFIIEWLERCLNRLPEANNRMTEFFKQYIEICKTL